MFGGANVIRYVSSACVCVVSNALGVHCLRTVIERNRTLRHRTHTQTHISSAHANAPTTYAKSGGGGGWCDDDDTEWWMCGCCRRHAGRTERQRRRPVCDDRLKQTRNRRQPSNLRWANMHTQHHHITRGRCSPSDIAEM